MENMIFEICQADAPNKNKNIYSKKLLETQIAKFQETIKQRAFFGELDKPQDSIIHFNNVSHLVVDLFMDQDKLMAEVEFLDTPSGRILSSLIDMGTKIEFNMHGIGSVTENKDGNYVVDDNYKLIQIFATKANNDDKWMK